MTTESDFTRFSGSLSRFKFDDETLLPFPDQYVDASSTMDNSLLTPDTEPCNSAQCSVEGDFLADDNEFSESVLKYISQMLMEEDMEEQQILADPLALQAAEKSLHQVLDGNLPSSSNHYPSYTNSPDDSYYYSGNSSDYGALSSSDYSGSFGGNGNSFGDFAENGGSASPPIPQHLIFQSSTTDPPLFQPSSGVFFSGSHASKMVDSLMDQTKFSNSTTQSELMSQFQKGVEEANKFLPNLGNQWFTNLDKVSTYNLPPKEFSPQVKVEEDNETHIDFSNGFREKKNHEREDAEIEGRSSKQSVIDLEEIELSDMFDKMFIFPDHEKRGRGGHCKGPRKGPPRDAEAIEDPTPKPRPKKPLNTNHANKEMVDLRMLLILAAQAVNADDRKTAHEYLKQIRQHSSPLGDGSQRMAHYFANGLEARLDGNGSQIYNALASKRISPIDVLKAYQIYLSVCPFQKLANIFSNNKILILAEDTKSLHIIDFGILYGFQWPALIFRLSKRPGGPPRLRITGIELPDRGFRPAERVLQTGRHLAKCCERFNVPFEYNGIAQKWETITTKDLNLREEDMVVVNCMFRFKNLLDQTVVLDNPRDSVLNLVKNINPNLFTLSVVNGSYGVPFFVTRFREALFHYSSLFDSLDANLPVDDPMRMMFEKEWYGREIMNVIACEGSERVERPETYKRWQIRNVRVGFKQVSLDPMIMKKLRFKLKGGGYNDEFVIDEDGEWMLQGWKGRIVYASSYWVTDGKG